MTLLHFDLRKSVRRTGIELIFYKIRTISKKATTSTQKASY